MRDPRRRGGSGIRHLIDRRTFLLASVAAALAPRLAARAAVPPGLDATLEKSALVYVSPLLADGRESACHGEVWFAWLDGSAVIITARDRWKARAVLRGLDRARLWVGDHGPWKQLIGHDETFRKAPSFEARAAISRDAALLDRVLASFERKYPAEIERWRDRMRRGVADGTRVVIAYTPV